MKPCVYSFPSRHLPLASSFHHLIQSCLFIEKIQESSFMETMNHSKDKEEKTDQIRERYGKEACESVSLKRISDDIMPHILNLYGSCATAHDFEIYAPLASFEDPLMCAHGMKQIKSAFYSLPKVFSESKIIEYSVEEHIISARRREITIDNKQHYKFWGRNIDMISLIKLYIEDGKVVRHEDWWDKKPLWNRETVKLPLVGRILEMTRRGSMLATHAMMGFGKDPTV
ncbi:Nuclear transport factor 2 (NTF2) family protein [Melia azedarach]|uniref:Nuclear transport factor 2 (NTF2) family protein n=2 Tax=Melia azedarach TaxID=155640 RepID=A0ACC1YBT8_MELAZ|nr:Nuclear transport factor 2 (NTF2) family protein [Melia azedarach]KAJ4720560.1 Nuclear transport factor 2 (NTF2) family protein [Melia azedarach]